MSAQFWKMAIVGAHRARVANGWALFGIIAVSLLLPMSSAEAKTPGKTYCFNGICHRVNTIAEMVALVGRDLTFKTSFYDDCKRDRFNPCGLTSSGEVFRPNDADNAASPIYPNGTVLLLRNPSNGKSAVVRVNNAGPYWGKRKLDVSRGVADKLGFKTRGVADLQVRVVSAPSLAEAKYKKNRRYDAVPGPIGTFASLDQAQGGMMVAMALNSMSGSVFAPAAGKMLPALKTARPALVATLRFGNVVAAVEPAATNLSPADGLKAAARRLYGIEPRERPRRAVPSSLTADVTPSYPTITERWPKL
ncbi:MAG: hypothetical protein K2X41_00280 [Hyphomicrobium sp.]|nr:hypothetical protein [Hyphomicrobium sp.]